MHRFRDGRRWLAAVITIVLVLSLYVAAGRKQALAIGGDIYRLDIEAVNGTVFVSPQKDYYSKGDTVRLYTLPAAGYMFDCFEGDVTGSRLIADIVIGGDTTVKARFKPWEAPIGITEPEFGVHETYRMYDLVENRNDRLTYHQNAEGGFYTHYVDNTHKNATDSGNPYGTAEKPRKSYPKDSDVFPGSVIELHGTLAHGQKFLRYVGTKEQPIFFRGSSVLERFHSSYGEVVLNCEYLICENIKKTDAMLYIRSVRDKQAHHVAIRNCELIGKGTVAVAYSNGFPTPEEILPAKHAVFYANHIDAQAFDPEGGTFKEKDGGGIALAENSQDIWILDNLIHHCGGDSVGAGHAVKYSCKNVYVGRNTLHTNGENAIDVKEVDTIIVSQNLMFNFQGWSSGSDGTAAVFHYGPKYSPINAWFLFNEVFDCENGLQVGGDQEYPVYAIGNIFHNIHNKKAGKEGYGFVTWGCREVYLTGNVFYDVDNGVAWHTEAALSHLTMEGNIIANVKEGGVHLSIGSNVQARRAVIKDNLFYQEAGAVALKSPKGRLTISDWEREYGQLVGIMKDPGFVNPAQLDFHLQEGSAAIDAASRSKAYVKFGSVFRRSVEYDYDGNPRPQGGRFDIGAYEYVPAVPPQPKAGDLDKNGVINMEDFLFVLRNRGTSSADANWNDVRVADANADGQIDLLDVIIAAKLQ